MATFANASNQVAALKELYTGDDFMVDLVYKKNPFLALVNKSESPSGFAGKYIPVPTVFGTPQGRSATFATAQSNQTAPQLASFFVYRVSNYQIATITNELLEATKDNAGAFVDEAKLVMDTAFRNISNDVAHDLFASGTGSRGVIGSQSGSAVSGVVNPNTITLSDPSMVTQFEVGMVLRASATDGGAQSTDTETIVKVNRPGGIIVCAGSVAFGSLSAPWAANSYLYIDGDTPTAGASTTASYLKITGLASWMPTSAASAGENFWGVDRSQDSRLQGVFYDGRAQPIEEALIDASTLVAREGGQPDMAFCTFATYAALEKSLGSKVMYVDVKHDEAEIAFAGIKVHAPYGPITVIPDRNCTSKTMYLLQMDVWKLRSLGKAPHILTYGLEGLEGLRVGTSDALEIRIGLYGNLVCSAPGFNAVVQVGV